MRKVCFFTGTRADFGLLRPLINKFDKSKDFELQIIAFAMHLSSDFGLTYKEIEQQGYVINRKIETLIDGDTSTSVNKSIGLAQLGIADAISELKPDIAVILGDRTEMLAAATCCCIANIPIAHIHGGEVTKGAYDDAIRHSITKMSLWHFTSTEEYRQRVIQMGESPERVYNVGAIGLDSIYNLKLLPFEQLKDVFNFHKKNPTYLITYHPVTLEDHSAYEQITSLFEALNNFPNINLIFTFANSDTEGRIINEEIVKFVRCNQSRAVYFKSLGQLRYLSALQFVSGVIGNSSSGIIEVPTFNIPTINIGNRQNGRIITQSIINCENSREAIKEAIIKSQKKDFLERIRKQDLIYGNGKTSSNIFKVLHSSKIINLSKGFYDLKH